MWGRGFGITINTRESYQKETVSRVIKNLLLNSKETAYTCYIELDTKKVASANNVINVERSAGLLIIARAPLKTGLSACFVEIEH